ncbi:hypothetical protein NUW58_g7712 [Xylaria curta]|uniref:Uncharacterized protein n=1 Tax=Xylaria curta TaxID=42375 RepID=A0ACC1NFQ9_9PEZI|nr:hypothetical protein NUW58_g7712 [Xylaria curta]
MIKTRLAQTTDARQDIYYHVANEHRTDASGVRPGNLWSGAVFFILVAIQTLRLFLLFSSTCPEIQLATASLQEKSAPRFSKEQTSTGARSSSLVDTFVPVLMRRSVCPPPVPGTLWRELPEDTGEPWVIDGHVIPRGTKVGVNTYSLHHNEEYFSDPFAFVPERWLEDETLYPQASNKVIQDVFAAFSTGPRGC